MQKNKLREQFRDRLPADRLRRTESCRLASPLGPARARSLFPGVLACIVVAAAAAFLSSTTARR